MSAIISNCGRYRYALSRQWDATLPVLTFVMCNPSTADASQDDPTIRRCIGFAKRDGLYGGIDIYNLFALRATDPNELFGAVDRVGPDNERYLDGILRAQSEGITSSKIICAWGAHKAVKNAGMFWRGRAKALCVPLHCLGKTKDGYPKHPLYIRSDQPFEVFQ